MQIEFTEISSNFWLNKKALAKTKISESQLNIWITSIKHWQNIKQKKKIVYIKSDYEIYKKKNAKRQSMKLRNFLCCENKFQNVEFKVKKIKTKSTLKIQTFVFLIKCVIRIFKHCWISHNSLSCVFMMLIIHFKEAALTLRISIS